MPYHNYLKVDIEREKRLNRICYELEKYGECIIDRTEKDFDISGWNSTMKNFGIKTKPLVEKKLIEPIWIQRNNQENVIEKRLIRVSKGTRVNSIGNKKKKYFFKKNRK